jgi:hypothetical protein
MLLNYVRRGTSGGVVGNRSVIGGDIHDVRATSLSVMGQRSDLNTPNSPLSTYVNKHSVFSTKGKTCCIALIATHVVDYAVWTIISCYAKCNRHLLARQS